MANTKPSPTPTFLPVLHQPLLLLALLGPTQGLAWPCADDSLLLCLSSLLWNHDRCGVGAQVLDRCWAGNSSCGLGLCLVNSTPTRPSQWGVCFFLNPYLEVYRFQILKQLPWGLGSSSVVDHLSRVCKALGSIHSTTREK